jgi:hypothetical protein
MVEIELAVGDYVAFGSGGQGDDSIYFGVITKFQGGTIVIKKDGAGSNKRYGSQILSLKPQEETVPEWFL